MGLAHESGHEAGGTPLLGWLAPQGADFRKLLSTLRVLARSCVEIECRRYARWNKLDLSFPTPQKLLKSVQGARRYLSLNIGLFW